MALPRISIGKRERMVLGVLLVCAAVRFVPYAIRINASDLIQDRQAIEFTDRNGLRLGTILSRDQEHTAAVSLDRVSPNFLHAIVSAEDGRFFRRGPVDALALARSAWQAVQSRRIVSGGSTIPMQLARMVDRLPSTAWGKAEQIWVAWRIAAGMDRNQILEAYVNRLPMGGNIYGVEAASRTFFGVAASGLDLAQASMLAALPNDPTGLNPYDHFSELKKRQRYVLERMVSDRYIARADAERAETEELSFLPRSQGLIAAPHLQFWLADSAPKGTAVVRTTIDRPLQEFVEEQIRQVMRTLSTRNVHTAAALVIDNADGEVLAYAGSPDYFDVAHGGRNDGVRALRQPGSTLKPFLYEFALETRVVHPNTILADVPVHYAVPGNLLYSPTDYAETFAGPVRVRIALADSLNVPAVRVLERVGVPAFLGRLRELGFAHLDKPPDFYGLGLTLGGGEVSLWELAQAYAVIARDGRKVSLAAVAPGARERSPHDVDVEGSATAWDLVTDILSDAHARARSFGVQSALSLPFPAAVKTGTSSDFRDTWTVGYTPEFTVAVWVGNFDGEPMRRVSGVAGAAPLWNRIMLHLYENREPQPFSPPFGLVRRPICSTTGLRPTTECRSIVWEYLYPDDVAAYDAKPPSPSLPHEFDQWLALQPATDKAPASLRIVRPPNGAYFLKAPQTGDIVAASAQKLEFEAVGSGARPVTWTLNGRVVGVTKFGEGFFWTLVPGRFSLAAHSGGMSDLVQFVVAPTAVASARRGFSVRSP